MSSRKQRFIQIWIRGRFRTISHLSLLYNFSALPIIYVQKYRKDLIPCQRNKEIYLILPYIQYSTILLFHYSLHIEECSKTMFLKAFANLKEIFLILVMTAKKENTIFRFSHVSFSLFSSPW